MSRAEYERLIDLGFFEDERVELLYGVVVKMAPQKPPHSSPVSKLNMLLVPALVGRAIVRVQSSFAASDYSEPEPDIAVVPLGDYDHEHPRVAHLIVEVAYTSVRKDREVKRRLYAEAGVPEYWLVDVVGRIVEVFRDPVEGDYTSHRIHGEGESVHVLAFAHVEVKVSDVLPAPA